MVDTSNQVMLNAKVRKNFGKGFARRSRIAGEIPAVLYSSSVEPVHLLIPFKEIYLTIKKPNTLFSIKDDTGNQYLTLVKEAQYHPYKHDLKHIDFLIVDKDKKVEVELPIKVIGEQAPNTLLLSELSSVAALVSPYDIPEHIEADISNLTVGGSFSVSDLTTVESIEIKSDLNATVLTLQALSNRGSVAQDTESDSGE